MKTKARALLRVVAEDSVGTTKFFNNSIGFEDVKEAPVQPSPKQRNLRETGSSANIATIDFYHFYQNAIKSRVQKKLEEEEEKRIAATYPATIPAVTINLDDEESHPPILLPSSPLQPAASIAATPPRKLPKRRTGAQNLSLLK